MGRFLIFTGILLLIASGAFMMAAFGVFGEDVAAQIIIPFACNEGDSIRTQESYSSFENAQVIEFYCVDGEGVEENVTGTVVGIIIIGFGGLLLPGIGMIIGGSMMAVGRGSKTLLNSVLQERSDDFLTDHVIDLRDNPLKKGQFPQGTQQVSPQPGNPSGKNSLAAKLQQIEDARKQGLISQAEYEKSRQAILENMDD